MSRIARLAYGFIAYAVFLFAFLYAVGFLANLIVPKSIDSGVVEDVWSSIAINIALLSIFALQHSIMARKSFKTWVHRFIPQAIERSTYVLCASAAMIAMFYFWQPIGGVIWHVADPILRGIIITVMTLGWSLVFVSTWLINHFDLFGLRQSWYAFRGMPMPALEFRQPWLYRQVRHPLYVGWLCIFWFTPTMTLGHLVFAIGTTALRALESATNPAGRVGAFAGGGLVGGERQQLGQRAAQAVEAMHHRRDALVETRRVELAVEALCLVVVDLGDDELR